MVDATGRRRADVKVRDGLIVEVGEGLDGRKVLDADGCIVAPGLVDLHAHLREPGHGGGRDHRDRGPGRGPGRLHRGRGHAQHRAGHRLGRRRAPGARPRRPVVLRRAPGGRHHRRAGPGAAGAAGRDGRARACASSPTTARRAGRPPHAPGPGVRVGPRRHPGPALRGRGAGRRGAHARGRVVEPPRHPRHPGRGRGADGDARHRPGPAHRRRRALPAPVDGRVGRHGAARPRRRACRSPPRRPPTTSPSPTPRSPPTTRCSRSTRRCARTPTWPPSRPAWPTAPSTPSPPTTPPRAGGEGGAVRPGAAGHARAGDGPGPRAHRARPADRAGAGPVLVAAGPHRRAHRPARRPAGRGPPRQPVRHRPGGGVGGRARAPGQPQPQHALRRAQAHRARCATRCCGASPSSSTARPSDDPR